MMQNIESQPSEPIKYTNAITGENDIDILLTEAEAKERGYMDLEFILKYLEDENEFSMYFTYQGKKIKVDFKNPKTQYKKKSRINHERVLENVVYTGGEAKKNPPMCNLHDTACESCSG